MKSGRTLGTKKTERSELEKIAQQLASVRLIALAEDDHIFLRATATFQTRSFTAGNYKISVGINQALLHLYHPSFDRDFAYQATLAPETWSQHSKSTTETDTSSGGYVKGGLGFPGWFRLGGNLGGKTNQGQKAEHIARSPYPIVSITRTGWRIGTELGDPRAPKGALPQGIEHCLTGEYLSGRAEEHGEGAKDRHGAHALCVLRPNQEGNDPTIVATLFGTTGSLRVVIALSDDVVEPKVALEEDRERKEREETLRRTFVDICLNRAEAAYRDGGRTDQALTGEIYLSHHEIHAPKTSSSVPVKPKVQTK